MSPPILNFIGWAIPGVDEAGNLRLLFVDPNDSRYVRVFIEEPVEDTP